jgi:hypothetical protein
MRHEQQRQLDVLERGEHRDQVVELEDEADRARAPLRELAALSARCRAATSTSPRRRLVDAADQVQQRGLAEPDGPISATNVAVRDRERQPVSTGSSSVWRRYTFDTLRTSTDAIVLSSDAPSLAASVTLLPSFDPAGGASTTLSPPDSPWRTSTASPRAGPDVHRRSRTTPFSITHTASAPPADHAACGTNTRRGAAATCASPRVEHHLGAHLRQDARVAVEDRDLHQHRRLLAVRGGHHLAHAARERRVGVGVERDARRLAVPICAM